MSIAKDYGPLIETGAIDGFTYEVRGNTSPMVYVYREVNGKLYDHKAQMSGTPLEALVRLLISELPKAAKETA